MLENLPANRNLIHGLSIFEQDAPNWDCSLCGVSSMALTPESKSAK